MHLFRFSYPVSRDYPFKWFTPLALVGGLALAVLFSLLNLPANAYEIEAIITKDPNGTLKDTNWMTSAKVYWGDRPEPKCPSSLLSVGDRFFTTNQGFQYEVKRISAYEPTTKTYLEDTSIPYLNNTLEACTPQRVTLVLKKSDSQPPPTGGWISWNDSAFRIEAICTISIESGPAFVTIETKMEGFSPRDFSYVITSNHTTHASHWWGTRLANLYWFSTLAVLGRTGYLHPRSNGWFNRGRLHYKHRTNTSKTIHDVDFFELGFDLEGAVNDRLTNIQNWNNGHRGDEKYLYNNKTIEISPGITEGSYFAKAAHSLVALDLGNSVLQNVLLNASALQDFLLVTDNMNRDGNGSLANFTATGDAKDLVALPYPEGSVKGEKWATLNNSWAEISPYMGELGTKPATIHRQYTCSVPQAKSTGRVILLVLVADLVFLQVAWVILKWVADTILKRQDPAAMFCQGCLKSAQHMGMPLETVESRENVAADESTRRLVPTPGERRSFTC